jgi:hypothetical protein
MNSYVRVNGRIKFYRRQTVASLPSGMRIPASGKALQLVVRACMCFSCPVCLASLRCETQVEGCSRATRSYATECLLFVTRPAPLFAATQNLNEGIKHDHKETHLRRPGGRFRMRYKAEQRCEVSPCIFPFPSPEILSHSDTHPVPAVLVQLLESFPR